MALAVFGFAMATVVTDMYLYITTPYTEVTYVAQTAFCTPSRYIQSAHIITLLISRPCAVMSDMILLAVTWYKTYKLTREVALIRLENSVISLVLKDGSAYFFILLILNILQMVLEFTQTDTDSLTVYFIPPISSILISRFMLHLRRTTMHTPDDLELRTSAFVEQGRSLDASANSEFIHNQFGWDAHTDEERNLSHPSKTTTPLDTVA